MKKLTKIRFWSYLFFGILFLFSGIFFLVSGNTTFAKLMFMAGSGQMLIYFALTFYLNRGAIKKKNL